MATVGLAAVLGAAGLAATAVSKGGPVDHLQPASTVGQLRFEPNVGQTDPRVRFVARAQTSTVFLTPEEAVIRLEPAGRALTAPHGPVTMPERGGGTGGAVLRMRPLGANPAASVAGLDHLEGMSNYLIGGAPSGWHTQVPGYGQVRYQGIYPGIDLLYHSGQGGLEYDFVVGPGADPSTIALAFAGQDRIGLEHGALVLDTAAGRVTQPAPRLYQEVGGSRQAVSGGYVLSGGRVSFAVGRYDRHRPLVIDPLLAYSTFLGGTGWDMGTAIRVDRNHNAYVTGTTSSIDFPTTAGAVQTSKSSIFVSGSGPPATCPSPDGCRDVFVSKLDPTGSHLVYSTYLGGRSNNGESDPSLALDAGGRAVVGGATDSNPADFPGTSKTTIGPLGATNAFVTVLSADGSQAIRTTLFGGKQSSDFPANRGFQPLGVNRVTGVAAGAGGDVYVTGDTNTTDFPTTLGSFEPVRVCTVCDEGVVFVAKLDSTGQFTYSTYIGHSGGPPLGLSNFNFDAVTNAIAVDPAGDVVIAGATTAPDYPVTPGAYQAVRPDGAALDVGHTPRAKGFITKLNPSGSLLLYSTYLGAPYIVDPNHPNTQNPGTEEDALDSVALDAAGDIYVAGWSHSPNFPTTPGAYQTARVCSSDVSNPCPSAVVSKLHPAGLGPLDLVASTYLGGPGDGPGAGALENDGARGVAVRSGGEVFVTGVTSSTGFPVTVPHGPPLGPAPAPRSRKAFITRFDPTLSRPLTSATLGGGGTDIGRALALDASGVYLAGYTTSSDFPTTPSAVQTTLRGVNTFVTKLSLPAGAGGSPPSGLTIEGQVNVSQQGLSGSGKAQVGDRGSAWRW